MGLLHSQTFLKGFRHGCRIGNGILLLLFGIRLVFLGVFLRGHLGDRIVGERLGGLVVGAGNSCLFLLMFGGGRLVFGT